MRTVDALTAARDFFLYDPSNWTKASLALIKNNGKACFCALGGISLVTGCMTEGGARHPRVAVSSVSGPWGAETSEYTGFRTEFAQLPKHIINLLRDDGVELAAAVGAVKYLRAACEQLFREASIVTINDDANYGYADIMKAFDLAIKNAKRRHINGDRVKAVSL